MTFDPETHHRQSIRLRGYDYSQPGAYYIAICSHGKRMLFGNVVDGEMIRNASGDIVATEWSALPKHYPHVE